MKNAADTERLILAAKENRGKETQTEVALLLDITTQTLTNWKSRGIPNAELLRVAEIVKVNPYWIRDGEPAQKNLNYPLDRDLMDLIKVAEKLPHNLRQALTKQGDLFAELAEEVKGSGNASHS